MAGFEAPLRSRQGDLREKWGKGLASYSRIKNDADDALMSRCLNGLGHPNKAIPLYHPE